MPNIKTRSEAVEEERRITQEIRDGKTVITFGKFVTERYLPWADQNKRAPENDHTRSKALVKFFGADRLLSDITLFNIEQYKRARAKTITTRGTLRAPGTINNELAVLSRMFSLAGSLVPENPMRGVKFLEEPTWRTRSLKIEEESCLIPCLTNPEYLLPIVRFALLTGLRAGEILGLMWEHCRLDRSLIYIAETKWKNDERKTKGLPISGDALDLLLSLKQWSEYVFPSASGTKIFLTNLTRYFRRCCLKAQVLDFRFHDLRHSFGTRMAQSGISLPKLQKLMGHQDPKMTMRYIHTEESELRDALNAGTPYLRGIRPVADTGKLRDVG